MRDFSPWVRQKNSPAKDKFRWLKTSGNVRRYFWVRLAKVTLLVAENPSFLSVWEINEQFWIVPVTPEPENQWTASALALGTVCTLPL
jgi:hypothetical protein